MQLLALFCLIKKQANLRRKEYYMNKHYAIILAVFTGIFLAVQPTINGHLGKVATPKLAALNSIIISGTIMLIVNIIGGDILHYTDVFKTPPLYWIGGGLMGAGIVFFTVLIIPELGPSAALSIFVVSQLVTGAIIDHFGLLGVPAQPINAIKIIGFILMFAGVKLII